jgi:hypothetical protein
MGETVEQVRRRHDNADYRSKKDDAEHKRKLDPASPEYDASYAGLWILQQEIIRGHNALQRSHWLGQWREYDRENNRPAGPDPLEPDDDGDGDDLYNFSFHRDPPRTTERRATVAQQHQEGIQHARQSGAYEAKPKTKRCEECAIAKRSVMWR